MARSLRLSEIVKPIFSPPFKGLAAVVWVYFVICFLINPDSQILKGNFPDPDGYLHLTQAMDLLRGQGWFDPIQHRLNPPDGAFIHFSKLVSILYAVPIYILKPLFGMVGAATIVAAIAPLVFYALLLMAMTWTAKAFMDKEWAGLTAFVTLFGTALMFKYAPGQPDHHAITTLLCITAFGCTARMALRPQKLKWPFLTGTLLALALVIGLETLPVITLVVAGAGIWAMAEGGKPARAGMVFGTSLFLASLALLLLTQSSDYILGRGSIADTPGYSSSLTFGFSIIYVILTASIAVCFAGVAAAAQTRWTFLRYTAGIGLAAATSAAFLYFFPGLREGPYGAMDPAVSKFILTHIAETEPLLKKSETFMLFLCLLLWPAMALASSIYFLKQSSKKSLRWIWGLTALLLAAFILLVAFYQSRLLIYAQLFCPIPLAAAFQKSWMATRKKYSDGFLCAARVGLILLVGPLPMVLLPALWENRGFSNGVVFFANPPIPTPCDMHTLASMLTLPEYYGDRPRVIMNTLNEGPELIFRTRHEVLSAPYFFRSGNEDATRFFSTHSPAEARKIALRRGVELVVMCKALAQMYVPPVQSAMMSEDGGFQLSEKASFAQQLAHGRVPLWLKPVHFPLLGNMMLFEVKPPKESKAR